MRNSTRRLTTLSLITAFALILSFIESRLPAFTAIPGIKVGLANIAVIFVLYKLGAREAVTVSLVRVLMVSILFGSPVSLVYSILGAALSLTVMIIMKRLTPLSEVTVSIIGAICHNIGQIAAASIMLGTNAVIYYLPYLLVFGIIAGLVVGIAGGLLIKRIELPFDITNNAKNLRTGVDLSQNSENERSENEG